MQKDKNITKKIISLSNSPGVYFFVDKNKEILYVGKATSLKSRVRSYFTKDISDKRSPLIAKMVEEIKDIKIEKTNSVLEALILEASLIKKLQPRYNTDQKDQKSWNFVAITEEEFPRVFLMRERELTPPPAPSPRSRGGSKEDLRLLRGGVNIKTAFGPFPHSRELKEALRITRKIFPYRDKCKPNTRACLNYELGLCPGVCVGSISSKDYLKNISYIEKFFSGKTNKLISELKRDMKKHALNREFEEAEKTKRQIFALQHINDVALLGKSDHQTSNSNEKTKKTIRIEAYDVAHTSGKDIVGVMTVVEDSQAKKSDYRMFKIREQKGADDTKALKETLERRLKHTGWPLPDIIVVDGAMAQLNTAKAILEVTPKTSNISLVTVTKDEHHKPREIQYLDKAGEESATKYEKSILLANAEAHRFGLKYHRKLRDKIK